MAHVHRILTHTVKPVLSSCSKRRPKIVFQDGLLLNAGQKYCRMLQESILQYFRPSLSYHLSFRSYFCLFLSGPLRQVLLYPIQSNTSTCSHSSRSTNILSVKLRIFSYPSVLTYMFWLLKRTVSLRRFF